jgi:hypothetical protein
MKEKFIIWILLKLRLLKCVSEERSKSITISKNWKGASLKYNISEQCDIYQKDGWIYFVNWDGNNYEFDITKISQNLLYFNSKSQSKK